MRLRMKAGFVLPPCAAHSDGSFQGLLLRGLPPGVRVMAVLYCVPLPGCGQGVRPLSLVTWLLSMETRGDASLCFPACFSCPVSYSVNHFTWKDG